MGKQNNRIARQQHQVKQIERSPYPSQITQLHQPMWFWSRHSYWSYFNRGLFWGTVISFTAVSSALGGSFLTRIDAVERVIVRTLETDLVRKLKPDSIGGDSLSKYIPSTVLARWRSPDRSPIFSQDLQDSSIAVQNTTNNPELGMRVVAFLRNQNFRDVYLSALELWSVAIASKQPVT